MKNNNSGNVVSGGLGLATVLTLIFVVLKLTKVISWSWWWVLAPLWIDLIIAVLVFVFWIILAVILERRN